MRAGVLATLFSLAMSFQSKAEVLLANTNTANGTTNINLNIRITASSLTLLQDIKNLRLFGTSGQTISASFGWYLGSPQNISGVEVGATGAYNFDLSTLVMPPSDSGNNYYMELRTITASGSGINTVANSASTFAKTGYTLTGYNGANIQFEMTTAVPEPGTLILGGIAAACGGTGVWWKRRRRSDSVATQADEIREDIV